MSARHFASYEDWSTARRSSTRRSSQPLTRWSPTFAIVGGATKDSLSSACRLSTRGAPTRPPPFTSWRCSFPRVQNQVRVLCRRQPSPKPSGFAGGCWIRLRRSSSRSSQKRQGAQGWAVPSCPSHSTGSGGSRYGCSPARRLDSRRLEGVRPGQPGRCFELDRRRRRRRSASELRRSGTLARRAPNRLRRGDWQDPAFVLESARASCHGPFARRDSTSPPSPLGGGRREPATTALERH